jgi:hypothetical protein
MYDRDVNAGRVILRLGCQRLLKEAPPRAPNRLGGENITRRSVHMPPMAHDDRLAC